MLGQKLLKPREGFVDRPITEVFAVQWNDYAMSLLSRLNPSLLSANAIAQYESYLDGSAKKDAEKSTVAAEPAAFVTLSSNGDVSDLEKHISDYEAGKGNLSQAYYGKLAGRKAETNGLLASSNPEASALYSAYSTISFQYGQEARFTTGTNQTAKQSAELSSIAERLEQARNE